MQQVYTLNRKHHLGGIQIKLLFVHRIAEFVFGINDQTVNYTYTCSLFHTSSGKGIRNCPTYNVPKKCCVNITHVYTVTISISAKNNTNMWVSRKNFVDIVWHANETLDIISLSYGETDAGNERTHFLFCCFLVGLWLVASGFSGVRVIFLDFLKETC